MKGKKLTILIICSVLTVVLVALTVLGLTTFGVFYSRESGEKESTKYFATEDGTRIANVPYGEYVEDLATPTDGIRVALKEGNDAQTNGELINQAINSLGAQGGTVIIPEGKYFTNTVFLKSNVTLFLSKGAELISVSYEDNEKSSSPLFEAVIYAENAENISVTGGGTVNGNGLTYTSEPRDATPFYALEEFNTYVRVVEARKRLREGKTENRANIIDFKNCTDVNINNVILKDSAYWTLELENSKNVSIFNLVIDNDIHVANSDGIDICGGENYAINHCFIATGDDAIVLKTPKYPIKNVSISDVELCSSANCFKIGTETQYDIENVTVDDCYFFMPDGMTYGYAGIAVESVDGANVRDISVTNVKMEGVSAPLLIWLGNRFKYDKKDIGSVDGVTLENIEALNVEMPSAIIGLKDGTVKNVTIDNFTSVYRDTAENLNVKKRVGTAQMSGYPEITRVSHVYILSHETSKYWDLPCYSLLVKNAENVDYQNVKTTPRTANEREEYYLENVI